jgi:hypothetical protein
MKVALQLATVTRIITDLTPPNGLCENNGNIDSTENNAFHSSMNDSAGFFGQTIPGESYIPERAEADLFADFLSMDNNGTRVTLFEDWNFFDLQGASGNGFADDHNVPAVGQSESYTHS